MKEEFLSFIWKHQYFDKRHLKTVHGATLQILDPGAVNINAGPDFTQARIRIDGTEWAGSVEFHIRSSDWYLHHHHQDPSYDQVILHVVWTNNKAVKSTQGQEIPTLALNQRVSSSVILQYRRLDKSKSRIPCERLSGGMDLAVLRKMMNRTIRQRIQRKTGIVSDLLQKNHGDWDQVTYSMFGRNFGFHVNSYAFSILVQSVPLTMARKVAPNSLQLEALFFGQAGLLEAVTGDAYYRRLQSEYLFLKHKYGLPSSIMKTRMWKYLRLRPSNFPALRIAQFTSFVHREGYRFSKVRELKDVNSYSLNKLAPSDYWRSHYDFGKSGGSGGRLGRNSCYNLMINSVLPLLIAYANYTSQEEYYLQAIALGKQIPPENNRNLAYWKDTGFELSSALDSQALLELNNQYCNQKRCLSCEVGVSLLKARNI